jgi:hypothetical protein
MSPALLKFCTETLLTEWSWKCKLTNLKTGKDCYVHNLLFVDNQVAITQGVNNTNYVDRKIQEECEKWGLKSTIENGIPEYKPFK